ncbi:MAG TPA: hypothetical protein VLH35_03090 [Candidatus Acidoferrales bacterium]|nr:hypothetical protein [Candidatus Acidoferrales bacterium]
MQPIKSFHSNHKAVSNIIFIITVIVLVVVVLVVAIVGGLINFNTEPTTPTNTSPTPTPAPEKVEIKAITVSYNGSIVNLYASSTGSGNPIPKSITIKDSAGNSLETSDVTVANGELTSSGGMAKDALYTLTATFGGFSDGTYRAVLTTQLGRTYNSQTFTLPATD